MDSIVSDQAQSQVTLLAHDMRGPWLEDPMNEDSRFARLGQVRVAIP